MKTTRSSDGMVEECLEYGGVRGFHRMVLCSRARLRHIHDDFGTLA
jgi:hypothetical protein